MPKPPPEPSPDQPPHDPPTVPSPSQAPPWPQAPAPIGLWLSEPLPACPLPDHDTAFGEPPCAWRWPSGLWRAVITGYARPGDRVLVSDAGPGLPAARAALDHGCSIAARVPSRLHRIGTRLELLETGSCSQRRRVMLFSGSGSTLPEPAAVAAPVSWPSRVRRELADLLVIPPPCPAEARASRRWSGAPLAAADPVLAWQQQLIIDGLGLVRPRGVVAVLTRDTPLTGGLVDRLGPLIAHAKRRGLTYLQHVPIVTATIDHDRLVPANGPDDRARAVNLEDPAGFRDWMRLAVDRLLTDDDARTPIGPVDGPLLHMPVHCDLLVFATPSGAAA